MTRKLASILTLGILIIGPALAFTGCAYSDAVSPEYGLGQALSFKIAADTASHHGAPIIPSKADTVAEAVR